MRKLCVGAQSIDDLKAWQAGRLAAVGSIGHVTRMWPRRLEELLDGGSLYWIIKGVMTVRQPILAFEEWVDHETDIQTLGEVEGAKPKCHIVLSPEMVRVDPRPHRPFQGWRYLKPDEAPVDLGDGSQDGVPPELAAELRAIGVI